MVFFPVASFASFFFLIIVENTRPSLCVSLVGIFFFAYIFSAHLVFTALLYSICTPLLYSNDKLHPQPVLHFLSFFFITYLYIFPLHSLNEIITFCVLSILYPYY